MKPYGCGLFFIGLFFFLITDSVSLLVICLCILFLPDSILGDCVFLGIYSFLLWCTFWRCVIAHSDFL